MPAEVAPAYTQHKQEKAKSTTCTKSNLHSIQPRSYQRTYQHLQNINCSIARLTWPSLVLSGYTPCAVELTNQTRPCLVLPSIAPGAVDLSNQARSRLILACTAPGAVDLLYQSHPCLILARPAPRAVAILDQACPSYKNCYKLYVCYWCSVWHCAVLGKINNFPHFSFPPQ